MTLSEWRDLTAQQRRDAWGRMSVEERLDLYGQLAANSPVWALPYPVDYNDPADTPLVMRELALATDTALSAVAVGSANIDHTHIEFAGFAPKNHNHDGRYAPAQHGHGYLDVRTINLGTIGPGDEVTSGYQSKASNQIPAAVVVIAPSSTYLLPVLFADSSTQWRVKVRNTTQQTTHTNVTVYVTLMREG